MSLLREKPSRKILATKEYSTDLTDYSSQKRSSRFTIPQTGTCPKPRRIGTLCVKSAWWITVGTPYSPPMLIFPGSTVGLGYSQGFDESVYLNHDIGWRRGRGGSIDEK